MPGPARAGTVLFSNSLDAMVAFYRDIPVMACQHRTPTTPCLKTLTYNWCCTLPAQIAAGIHLSDAPARREQVPVRLFASVTTDIEAARRTGQTLGGDVFGTPWQGPSFVAVDVADLEGNVLQLPVWPT